MRFTYVLIAVTALAGCASEPAKQASEPSSPAVAAPVATVAATATEDSAAKADPDARIVEAGDTFVLIFLE